MQKIEEIILKNFFENSDFSKKVVPFIKLEYFSDHDTKMIMKKVLEYIDQYKTIPNYETTFLTIQDDKKLKDTQSIVTALTDVKALPPEKYEIDFLMKETEKYFQETALSKAVIEAAEILGHPDQKEKQLKKASIPEKIRNALKISFDTKLGQEYLTADQIESQYFYYHHKERKYPFARWKHMNTVMDGGPCKKTLNLFMGVSGSGKTTWLCNVAEQFISTGIDVLYVTLEVAEEELIKRCDGNLLDTKIRELPFISKPDYTTKLSDLKQKGFGRLVVKEYPPASINCQTIRFLLDELKLRQSFTPTCLIVDYIGLMNSIRLKSATDMYSYGKTIVEELRGLAVERELVVFSGIQFNRGAYGNSDAGLANTSESMGSVFTADWIGAIIETDELKANGQQMIKQLKSRYDAILPTNERWLIEIIKDKQRVEELPEDQAKMPVSDLMPGENKKPRYGHMEAESELKF